MIFGQEFNSVIDSSRRLARLESSSKTASYVWMKSIELFLSSSTLKSSLYFLTSAIFAYLYETNIFLPIPLLIIVVVPS